MEKLQKKKLGNYLNLSRNNVEFIDEENIKYCYLEYHCGNA